MSTVDAKALLEGVTDPRGWQIKGDYVPDCFTIVTNVDGEIHSDGSRTYSYDFIATCVDEFDEFSADAVGNARLIAAAPHLAERVVELERQLLMVLAAVYGEAPRFVATICDEKLDRSGALLGKVRELARAAISSNGSAVQ